MTTGSWPKFANSCGRLPQTSPSPPVLAKGTASVVAKRIFKVASQGCRAGYSQKIAHFSTLGQKIHKATYIGSLPKVRRCAARSRARSLAKDAKI